FFWGGNAVARVRARYLREAPELCHVQRYAHDGYRGIDAVHSAPTNDRSVGVLAARLTLPNDVLYRLLACGIAPGAHPRSVRLAHGGHHPAHGLATFSARPSVLRHDHVGRARKSRDAGVRKIRDARLQQPVRNAEAANHPPVVLTGDPSLSPCRKPFMLGCSWRQGDLSYAGNDGF